jgi:hypothetical protein
MSNGTASPEHRRTSNGVVPICVFSVVGIMLTAAAVWFGFEFL